MRKFFLLLIATTITYCTLNAQYVNIPDNNFRNFLIQQYPSCFNSTGKMDTSCNEIANDTILTCYNQNIANITGINILKIYDI